MDLTQIGDFLQKFGLPLAELIIIVVTGQKKVWVFGWYADELRNRAERAEAQRDQALTTANRAVSVAEKVT
jgi:hypothetical protein